tara:strand:- start:3559 stop:4725 length:1167 start_codon:yes stop_codon:yes gene_type:complete
MKILIVNTLYSPYKIGGAEISVQALAEEFNLLGITVGVLTLGESDDFEVINNISIWRLKLENIFWPFNNQLKSSLLKLRWHAKDANNKGYDKKIKSIFESYKPDILFTNNLSGFSTRIWELAKPQKIKVVHTIRDYYLQCPKTTKFKNGNNCDSLCLECKVLTALKKRNSTKIDYVVGISNFVLQDHLKQGYFKNVKSKVIYNGFNFDFKHKQFKFLNKEEVVFGYLGQINKEKGVELMLESFGKIKNKEKWRLLVAGNIEKEYKSKLKGINDNNRIEYLGYTNSTDFFKKIDVLIVPSLWNEPFGRVVLEGIINNKIVITSKKGGIIEIMENNQDFTFNLGNEELKNLIDNIIDKRNKLKYTHNQEFLTKFNIKRTALDYYETFSKI